MSSLVSLPPSSDHPLGHRGPPAHCCSWWRCSVSRTCASIPLSGPKTPARRKGRGWEGAGAGSKPEHAIGWVGLGLGLEAGLGAGPGARGRGGAGDQNLSGCLEPSAARPLAGRSASRPCERPA